MTISRKNIFRVVLIALSMLMTIPIVEAKKQAAPKKIDVELPIRTDVSSVYGNIDYGIRIQVINDLESDEVMDISDLPSKDASNLPELELSCPLNESVEQFLDNYASNLGIRVGSDPHTDFILRVTIKNFRLRIRDFKAKKKNISTSASMVIGYELADSEGRVILSPTTSTARAASTDFANFFQPLSKAYTQALKGINWNRIASSLKTSKSARNEGNKEVTGAGNTALEHTIIRWNIISSPQGADVSWRVVSSTPDVANTNANFIGYTPYESTESFDVKGLTYNNSGNVQIEVTCEKPGYLPQKKRFNLRQAVDQKEISAKFTLVKEEDEAE